MLSIFCQVYDGNVTGAQPRAREGARDTGRARLAGVVLAAGRSSRMGRDKPGLPFRGRTFLERALDAARALEPVVLVGPRPPAGFQSVLHVPAPGREPALSRSLAAGLAALPPDVDGAIILLADMPLVTAELVLLLSSAFAPGRFLAPVYQGRRGNPVAIPSNWFGRVAELSGDAGARRLLDQPEVPVDFLDVDDPAVVTDVDTQEDLDLLERMAGER